ncbi:MAG: hypothetical protein H6Q75_1031 [Firmicutes bacterium]|nr:hypothetical protein [Bacillota bacterium]
MNGRYGQLAVSLGILLVFMLVMDTFLTSLVRNEQFQTVGYIMLLVVLGALIMYVIFLKHSLLMAGKKIAIYNYAWRQIPCSFAVTGKEGKTEIYGAEDLFQQFGFSGAKTSYNVWAIPEEEETDPAVQPEVCVTSSGTKRYAERIIVPVLGINGGYVAEFLFDVSERLKKYCSKEDEYLQMIKILVNMFEMKDPYSHGHSEVVSALANDLARKMCLPDEDVRRIKRAALLHDVGKLVIPSDLLISDKRLTTEESNTIKAHSSVGADILFSLPVFRDIAGIVRHHHERFDGNGYPDRIGGQNIPLGARIIAVVDAFEVMTAGRVSCKLDVTNTLRVLVEEKARWFDPQVVDAFVAMVSEEQAKQM